MPAAAASLRAFRARRDAGGGADAAARAAAGPPMDDTTAGAAARFRALVLPHLDAAYNLARHLACDATAAEDIVQDAFLRALGGFAAFRGGDARAWILQIVRNRFYDWAREQRPERAVPLSGSDAEDDDGTGRDIADPDQATPEQALAVADEASAVQAVVARLPAPFREALVLREFEDLSYRQIAEVTGVPIGTVMSRLARARQLFSEAWRRAPGGGGSEG